MASYGEPTKCPSCKKYFKPVIYTHGPQICCSMECKTSYKFYRFYQDHPIHNFHNDLLIVPLTKEGYFIADIIDQNFIEEKCWQESSEGYVYRTERKNGKNTWFLFHRELLSISESSIQVDHINLNKLDNRRSNLRKASHRQNSQNLPSKGGTSLYRGVRLSYGKWESYSWLNNDQFYLGRYNKEIEAAKTSESFRRKHMEFSVPILSLDPLPDCKCKLCK